MIRAALVTIGSRTDIALFVNTLGSRTTAGFILIGSTSGGANPGIEKEMEILFVGVSARTFHPYRHRIRTVFPFDSAFRSGRSTIQVQTLQILPGATQRHIARTGSSEVEFRNTDGLICHIDAIARATLLLVHEREFRTYLAHIRSMPILQLYITLELIRPVLKMRVG